MRKGQAAMEFLMTYGWAILVVLAAIGALAYFGVLSPNSLLPERTTFQAPLPSIDNAVVSETDEDVEIAFRNSKGTPITVTAASGRGTEDCLMDGTVTITGSVGVSIPNGEVFTLTFPCTTFNGVAGDRFKSDITFTYTDDESSVTRPHSGTVQAKITA